MVTRPPLPRFPCPVGDLSDADLAARPLRVLIGCECMPIPGFPSYMATTSGDVISLKSGEPKIMSRRPHKAGYNLVTLCDGGQRKTMTLHRVIASAFHPNPDGLPCVRHLDGDKANCTPSNLAWGTYADNEADKIATGTRRYGTAKMKLNAKSRAEVLALHAAGTTPKEMAALFGVNRSTITRLIAGSTWSNRKWPMAETAARR